MATLLFLQPGHFHAALLLRDGNERVDRSVPVYATPGPDLDRFLALVAGFNSRADAPTDWRLDVDLGPDPLASLIEERRGESVVIAGRNATRLATMRRLHDAGFNVLADKPWITSGAAVDDLRRVTAGPPVVMDIMTERLAAPNRIRRLLVADRSLFGRFIDGESDEPAIESTSIHHLCKLVDGQPLRRPEWYYDVEIQGDGLVDIQSHLVDQAQWLIDDLDRVEDIDLDRAERWSTPVPLSVFAESTGATAFPPSLRPRVRNGVLDLACNGRIDYRLAGVRVRQEAIWRPRPPAGGGDAHRSVARGTGAEITLVLGPDTGYRAQLHVGPVGDPTVADRLATSLAGGRPELADLSLRPSALGYRVVIPAAVDTGHEATFPPVLDAFLDRIAEGRWSPSEARRLRARYTLLARAHDRAGALGWGGRPPSRSERP